MLHLVEREMAAFEQGVASARCASGIIGKQPRHFLRRLQISFGIQGQQPAGLIEGHMLANAGDDILQHAAPGMMIENVIGGDQGNEIAGRDAGELRHAAPVVAAIEKAGCKPERLFRGVLLQFGKAASDSFRSSIRAGGITIRLRPSIRSIRSGRCRMQSPFSAFSLPADKQLRQPSPGGAVGGIGEDVGRAVGEDQPRARPTIRKPSTPRHDMRAHHARDRIAVGDADCCQAPRLSPAPPILPDARRRAGRRNWW